jgi:hypothetical protein
MPSPIYVILRRFAQRSLEGRRAAMPCLRSCAICVAAAMSFASAVAFADGRDYAGTKLANLPTDFIVGYGSLINSASRNSTATAPIAAIPIRVLAAFGYIRTWNERGALTHWTALGLRKPKPGEGAETINGVLYPVDAADLAKFDGRERSYVRVAVPKSQIEAVGWQPLPQSGHFWIYVPRVVAQGAPGAAGNGFMAPDADYPIVESYVDVVVEGGLEYGPDFAHEIIETTDGWNRFWLDDRETPHRPWVHDPSAMKVDQLLAAASATAKLLPLRAFPETYGDIMRPGGAGK